MVGSRNYGFIGFSNWDIVIEYSISRFEWSSRPRELPPQPLTQPDVNLSIHPAPIDQSIVAPIANAQTNMAFVSQYVRTNRMLFACVGTTFCISA